MGQGPHLTVLDCSTDSVVASLELPAIAVEPVAWGVTRNHVYVSAGVHLTTVDCVTDTVVGQEPGVFDQPGLPYVHDTIFNKLYCPSFEGLLVFDCDSLAVADTIGFSGHFVRDLDWAPLVSKAYCLRANIHEVVVIDCAGDSVLRFVRTRGWVSADLCVADSSRKLYYPDGDSIGVLGVATDSVLGCVRASGGIWRLLYNPAANHIYAWMRDRLFIIECSSDSVLDSLPCPGVPECLDPGRGFVYLLWHSAMYRLDLGSGLVTDTLIGDSLYSLLWDSTDNKLYALGGDWILHDDTLTVVDCSTFSVTRRIGLPADRAFGMVWNPLMNKLYVGGDVFNPDVGETAGAQPDGDRPRSSILRSPVLIPRDSRILDIQGRDVTDKRERLSPGIYFLRSADSGKRSAVQRIVIAR